MARPKFVKIRLSRSMASFIASVSRAATWESEVPNSWSIRFDSRISSACMRRASAAFRVPKKADAAAACSPAAMFSRIAVVIRLNCSTTGRSITSSIFSPSRSQTSVTSL